jgi:hypothetical protein
MTQNSAKGQVLSLVAGGDLSGTAGANTVIKMQNTLIKSGTPSDAQVLTYIAADSAWEGAAAPSYFSTFTASVHPATSFTGSSYTVGTNDATIIYVGSGTPTIVMPASAPVGKILWIADLFNMNNSTPTGHITLDVFTNGIQINGGGLTIVHSARLLCFDGTNWASIGFSS